MQAKIEDTGQRAVEWMREQQVKIQKEQARRNEENLEKKQDDLRLQSVLAHLEWLE